MAKRRGISSIKLLVGLPAIILVAWFSIEIGLAYRAVQQATNGADAAALAAAARLPDGWEAMREDAILAASANPGPTGGLVVEAPNDGPGGDIVLGRWDPDSRRFVPDPDARDAAAVTVRIGGGTPNGTPGFLLPGLLEIASLELQRTSVATWNPPEFATALLALGRSDTGHGLELDGNVLLDVFGGTSVASDTSQSVRVAGKATLQTAVLRTAGDLARGSEDGIVGEVERNSIIPEDPYEDLEIPKPAGIILGNQSTSQSSVQLEPGLYRDGLVVSDRTVTFLPGLFQFGAFGLRIEGTGAVELLDASIQLVGPNAILDLRDDGRLTGTPIATGDWRDVAILGARPTRITVTGRGRVQVPGVVYLPNGEVEIDGDAVVIVDAAVTGSWTQVDSSTARVDRVIIETDRPTAGRARLRR